MIFNIVPGFLVDFFGWLLGLWTFIVHLYLDRAYPKNCSVIIHNVWLLLQSLSCIQPRPVSLSQTLLGRVYQGSTNQAASVTASLDLLILFWGRKRAYLCEHKLCYTIWPLGQKTACRLFQLMLCLYTLLCIPNVVAIEHLESMFPGQLTIPVTARSPASVWTLSWEFR